MLLLFMNYHFHNLISSNEECAQILILYSCVKTHESVNPFFLNINCSKTRLFILDVQRKRIDHKNE